MYLLVMRKRNSVWPVQSSMILCPKFPISLPQHTFDPEREQTHCHAELFEARKCRNIDRYSVASFGMTLLADRMDSASHILVFSRLSLALRGRINL